jgi:hypothetical protein
MRVKTHLVIGSRGGSVSKPPPEKSSTHSTDSRPHTPRQLFEHRNFTIYPANSFIISAEGGRGPE